MTVSIPAQPSPVARPNKPVTYEIEPFLVTRPILWMVRQAIEIRSLNANYWELLLVVLVRIYLNYASLLVTGSVSYGKEIL
jgi:hypothetical protein